MGSIFQLVAFWGSILYLSVVGFTKPKFNYRINDKLSSMDVIEKVLSDCFGCNSLVFDLGSTDSKECCNHVFLWLFLLVVSQPCTVTLFLQCHVEEG